MPDDCHAFGVKFAGLLSDMALFHDREPWQPDSSFHQYMIGCPADWALVRFFRA
jgi:hypothetical protein